MTPLREKLQSELQEVEWSAIRQHLTRDAVITVSVELDLLEVGERLATDSKAQIAEWIEQKRLSKPTLAELEHWEKQPGTKFRFLIVSPFVLIQQLAH